MSKGTSTTSSGGIGILSLLGVLFVGLKLTGYIDWSWCSFTIHSVERVGVIDEMARKHECQKQAHS